MTTMAMGNTATAQQAGGQVLVPQDVFGDILNIVTKVLPVVLSALSAPGPAARQA